MSTSKFILIVFAIIGVMLWCVPAQSAEDLRLAFLDAQRILDETKAGKRAKKTMEEYRDSRQKIIDLEENEIKRLQEELFRQQAVLGTDFRRTKEEILQKKLVEYQQQVQEFSRELDGKKRDILLEFNNGLVDVVSRIAEKEGYTFVFDRNAEGGVLLYAKKGFDITDKVIKEYDGATP